MTQNEKTDFPTLTIDTEVLERIEEIKTTVQSAFGQVVLAMSALPRYRHQSLADLSHLVIDPLSRDRIAIATPKLESEEKAAMSHAAIAIWATVSPEVDAKIREQIRGGSFPIRLKPAEWASGDIAWLFDVIAPSQKLASTVLTNFRQVVKTNNLRLHPIVTRLVDAEILKALGTRVESADVPKPQSNTESVSNTERTIQ